MHWRLADQGICVLFQGIGPLLCVLAVTPGWRLLIDLGGGD